MNTAPLLAAVLFLFLTACSRDNRQADVKQCSLEAQRHLLQDQSTNGAFAGLTKDDRHDAIGGMIAACMESHGYRHGEGAMTDGRCVDDVDYNPYCYERSR